MAPVAALVAVLPSASGQIAGIDGLSVREFSRQADRCKFYAKTSRLSYVITTNCDGAQ
jgi:hypothetical protein